MSRQHNNIGAINTVLPDFNLYTSLRVGAYDSGVFTSNEDLWAHTIPFIINEGLSITEDIGFKYHDRQHYTSIENNASHIKSKTYARSIDLEKKKCVFSMYPIGRTIDKTSARELIDAMQNQNIGTTQSSCDLQFEYLKEPSVLMTTSKTDYNFVFRVTDPATTFKQFIVITTHQSKDREHMWQDLAYIIYKKDRNEEIPQQTLEAISGYLMNQDEILYEEKFKSQTLELVKILKMEQFEKILSKLDNVQLTNEQGLKDLIIEIKNNISYLEAELEKAKTKEVHRLRELQQIYLSDEESVAMKELKDYIKNTVPESLINIDIEFNDTRRETILNLTIKNKMSLDASIFDKLATTGKHNPLTDMPEKYIEFLRLIAHDEITVYAEGTLRINLTAKRIKGKMPLDSGRYASIRNNLVNPHWGLYTCIGSLEDPMLDSLAHGQLIPMYQLAINAVGSVNLDDMTVCESFFNRLVNKHYDTVNIFDKNGKYICDLSRYLNRIQNEMEVPF